MSEYLLVSSPSINNESLTVATYLQKFSVHLASKLVGHDVVLKQFQLASHSAAAAVASTSTTGSTADSHGKPSFQLYWRSPLLIDMDVPAHAQSFESLMPSSSSSSWRTIFVDATFDFSFAGIPKDNTNGCGNISTKKYSLATSAIATSHPIIHKHKPSITVTWGTLVQSIRTHKGIYAQELSPSLTTPKLQQHIEQLDIDLEFDNPEPLAISMADAFLSLQQDLLSNKQAIQILPNNDNNRSKSLLVEEICIPLYYKELDETAYIRLTSNDATLSNIDPGAMTMLIRNLSSCTTNTNTDKSSITTKAKSTETMSALQKWCQMQLMIPQHDDDDADEESHDHYSPNQHHPQGEKSEITHSLSCSTSNKISNLPLTSKDKESNGEHPAVLSKGTNNQKVEESITAATTQLARSTRTSVGTSKQTKTKPPQARSSLSTGYIVVDRAASIKRRKRGKLTYSKMKE